MGTEAIKEKFGKKYQIKDDVVEVGGRGIHVAYLPFIDLLSSHPKEIAGAALYKVDRDFALVHFTDTGDPRLKEVYDKNKEQADKLATQVKRRLTQFYDDGITNAYASALFAGAFHGTFGQTYGDWRESLQN